MVDMHGVNESLDSSPIEKKHSNGDGMPENFNASMQNRQSEVESRDTFDQGSDERPTSDVRKRRPTGYISVD